MGKAIARQRRTSSQPQQPISASTLAEGLAQEGRYARLGATLSAYLDIERAKPTHRRFLETFPERADKVVSTLLGRAPGLKQLTEDHIISTESGSQLRRDAYALRTMLLAAKLDDSKPTAIELIAVAAGMNNSALRPFADSLYFKSSQFNPTPTRAAQREAARTGDPYEVRPPVKIGRRSAKEKSGFQAKDPYKGKKELAQEILEQAPFPQAIAFFGTYEQVPRFIKFELFPKAYKLAGGKPEILRALLLPEGASSTYINKSMAAFYTDLKNALAARKGNIPSVAVAEKIVQKVLSDREPVKMPDQTTAGTRKGSRLDVQKQEERIERVLGIQSSIPESDAESKSW